MKIYTLGLQSWQTTSTIKRSMNAFLFLVIPLSSVAANLARQALKSACSVEASCVGKMQSLRSAWSVFLEVSAYSWPGSEATG